MFFVCHSPIGGLSANNASVHLWFGAELAEAAINAGLFDWLTEKSS
jgi:hypothetical protein